MISTLVKEGAGCIVEKITVTDEETGRSVSIEEGRYEISLSVCTNGHQTTVVSLDPDMLEWVVTAVQDFIKLRGPKA